MSSVAPISLASTIIGFISFAFTIFTFLRVIAGNLETLAAAPTEVPFYLSNLKQELFEERTHLRRARRRAERYMRRCRRDGRGIPSWDSAPAVRLMEATVRQMCRQFRELEQPFLIGESDRGRGAANPSKAAEAGQQQQQQQPHEWDEWDDYMMDGFESDYGTVTLYHRWSWLRRKSAVQGLSTSLMRVQIRRIGRESTDALTEVKGLRSGMQDLKLVPGDGGKLGAPSGGFDGGYVGGGTRRRRSQARGGRRPADSGSESGSSSSSRSDVEKEKLERVHVRRSSRYRR